MKPLCLNIISAIYLVFIISMLINTLKISSFLLVYFLSYKRVFKTYIRRAGSFFCPLKSYLPV